MRSLTQTVAVFCLITALQALPTHAGDLTAWLTQAQATTGNVTASTNGGSGWTFDGSGGIAYDYGALDALDGKPIDGSTVEFVFNLTDAGSSTIIGSFISWSPGNEWQYLKLEQWNNTGKFGLTTPGAWDKSFASDSLFDQDVHLVLRRNSSGTLDLFINGVFVETEATKTNWRQDGGNGYIGSDNDGNGDNATGTVYGVASYDTALTNQEIADLYGVYAPPVVWGGTDGDWTVPGNWVGGAVPVLDGTNDVQISAGTANHAGQLDVTGGSFVRIDGGTLEQTTTTNESLSFQSDAGFVVETGGSLSAQSSLQLLASTANSVNNGTITAGQLILSNSSLTLGNLASVTAAGGQSTLDNGSSITATNSTLTLHDVSLGATGGDSRINVADGATVNLDTNGLGTATDVIMVAGDSFVNIPTGSTGTVFIDNIGLTDVQAMIAAGKFGLGGSRYISTAGYSLGVQGSGIVIGEQTVPFTVAWSGGDAEWADPSNWLGGEVPRTNGIDDATISNGTANYDGSIGDLTFTVGSQLILDGGNYNQTTANWLRFQGGSFAISNGSQLSTLGRLRIWRSAGNTVDGGTITAGNLQVDDNADLVMSNGATVTATTGQSILNNNSSVSVTGSTLNLRDVFLGAYAGNPVFIDVNDGGTLNLDAAGFDAGVITIEGGSFVNFAADSTGVVFIDNISQANVQTMIADGKFGIDRVRETTAGKYTLTVQGSGIEVRYNASFVPVAPALESLGFNGDGFMVIRATNLDPAETYDLTRGEDLLTFPDFVDNPITGVETYDFIDNGLPDGLPSGDKTFYRLERQP